MLNIGFMLFMLLVEYFMLALAQLFGWLQGEEPLD